MSNQVGSSTLYRRGEIYFADLDPVVGSEQGRRRPVLIVSPDVLNRVEGNNTVVVVPLSSQGKANKVRLEVASEHASGFALITQVRTLDKRRLETFKGEIAPDELRTVLTTLQMFFNP